MRAIIKAFKLKKVNKETTFDVYEFKTDGYIRPRYIFVKDGKLKLKDRTYVEISTVNPFSVGKIIEDNSYTKTDIANVKIGDYFFSIQKFKEEFIKDLNVSNKSIEIVDKKKLVYSYNVAKNNFSFSVTFDTSGKDVVITNISNSMSDVKFMENIYKMINYTEKFLKDYNEMVRGAKIEIR